MDFFHEDGIEPWFLYFDFFFIEIIELKDVLDWFLGFVAVDVGNQKIERIAYIPGWQMVGFLP